MEITRSGECTCFGGSLCSSSYLQYWYGLADLEKENEKDQQI